MNDTKKHWEYIFQNKDTTQVSWYQEKPQMSLDLIGNNVDSKSEAIIDIGGGDSRLPDHLQKQGYENISVLDISEFALVESKKRLGDASKDIDWIISNVIDFDGAGKYKLWHDRAVFHFIKDLTDQLKYKEKLMESLAPGGVVIIGAFSKNEGPHKCSGIEIQQHDRASIIDVFKPEFSILSDFEDIHKTPSGSSQNFYWSILKLN